MDKLAQLSTQVTGAVGEAAAALPGTGNNWWGNMITSVEDAISKPVAKPEAPAPAKPVAPDPVAPDPVAGGAPPEPPAPPPSPPPGGGEGPKVPEETPPAEEGRSDAAQRFMEAAQRRAPVGQRKLDTSRAVMAGAGQNRAANFRALMLTDGNNPQLLQRIYSSPMGKRIAAELKAEGSPVSPETVAGTALYQSIQYNLNATDENGVPNLGAIQDSLADLTMAMRKDHPFSFVFQPSQYNDYKQVAPALLKRHKERIEQYQQATGKEWTQLDWDNHMKAIAKRMRINLAHEKVKAPGGSIVEGALDLADIMGMGDRITGPPSVKQITNELGPATAAEVKATLQRANEGVKADPERFGFWNWAKSNMFQWLAPAGILMAIFGNAPMKILGFLAMGVGGWDVYKRYKTLTGKDERSKAIQDRVMESLNYYDPVQKKYVPFGDLDEIEDPEVKQAVMDMGFMMNMGLLNDFGHKVHDEAESLMSGVYGPGLVSKQLAESRKELGPRLSKRIRGFARDLTGGEAQEEAEKVVTQ